MEKLSNPQRTIEVIKKYEFCFQKKFGQNFLIDGHVLDKIIAGAGVTKDDMVLEIGPGIGCEYERFELLNLISQLFLPYIYNPVPFICLTFICFLCLIFFSMLNIASLSRVPHGNLFQV